ncbi:large conductance mechanosensitive channel protein MscL [Candidatus Saccharibacteria bacterium]|nr:large conductance mechanosensitive channel protein MscL [Candidatus Saccharibacteria bacterium]
MATKDQAKAKLNEVKEKSGGFRKEFIEFINRGSVVDLAVGVAVGGAFTAIVNSLVNDIIMPIVGLIGGGVNFTNLSWTIPNFFGTGDAAVIAYGNFIQNVVEFLIIAWVIFMIIKGMNRINRKKDQKATKEAAKKKPN